MENINGVKILVAEDNVLNQRIVKLILQKLGAVVSIVANGQEAIEAIAKNDFDVVLMDLNMPVLDGFETTKYIREVLNNSIPIIAITADNINNDEPSLIEAGMNGGISKPIVPHDFVVLINGLLKNRKIISQ